MKELSAVTNMYVVARSMHELYSNKNIDRIEIIESTVDYSDEDKHSVKTTVNFYVKGKSAFIEIETTVKDDNFDRSDDTYVTIFGEGIGDKSLYVFLYLPEHEDKDERLEPLLTELKSL